MHKNLLELKENIDKTKVPHINNHQINLTKNRFFKSIDEIIGDNSYELIKKQIIDNYDFFESVLNQNGKLYKEILLEQSLGLKTLDYDNLSKMLNDYDYRELIINVNSGLYSIFYGLANLDFFKDKEFTKKELENNEIFDFLSYFNMKEIELAVEFINYAKFDLSITELDAVNMYMLIGLVVNENIAKKYFDLILNLNNENLGLIANNGFKKYLEQIYQ